MPENIRYRFAFDITEETQRRANKLLSTYGIRKAVFNIILEDVLDLIEEHGEDVLLVIMSRRIKSSDVIDCLKEQNGNT
jgi:putative IMPACT (imprinted ancient) family translation regulator